MWISGAFWPFHTACLFKNKIVLLTFTDSRQIAGDRFQSTLIRGDAAHPSGQGSGLKTPNGDYRWRALIGTFAQGNPTQFNRADGTGYDFVADYVIKLNGTNPQVAARLMTAFKSWRALESGRRSHAEKAIRRVAGGENLSPGVKDIAERALAGG